MEDVEAERDEDDGAGGAGAGIALRVDAVGDGKEGNALETGRSFAVSAASEGTLNRVAGNPEPAVAF